MGKWVIVLIVLGFFLILSSTATSDVIRGELNPVIKVNPTNQRFSDISYARREQPSFKKPESALRELPSGTQAPTPPQTYFCDIQDYTSGNPSYYWPIPDAFGDDLFSMRFTSAYGYDCSLMVAHYAMYGTAMTGTPDMRCYLWDDDGFGFPGNKLDSVDIPYATLFVNTVPLGYVSADFTPAGNSSGAWWIFSDGEEYHYGWTPLLSDPGDTLAVISDMADGPYAGEEHSNEFWNGLWGTMLNDWGLDVSFFILSERCCAEIPFSDCYYRRYHTNVTYSWPAPHPTWDDEEYAMRYSVGGPETLQFVDIAIYDPADGSFGNDDVYITIYGDNGSGLPDPANIIAQVIIPAGTYPAYPTWTTADFSSFNLVMISDFHVAFSSSGAPGVEYESCLSSDGTDGVGRSTSYQGGGYWVDMLSGWGADVNFLFDVYMCPDPTLCFWNWCHNGVSYYWRLPDAWGNKAQAQMFQVSWGAECRVQEVAWYLYDNGTPTAYTANSKVSVYTDVAGLPGIELASITLTPSDYVMFPAATVVDFEPLNVIASGDYWVAIESFGTDSTDGIRTLSDAGGGGCADAWAEFSSTGWNLMVDDWGLSSRDWAALVEVYHCCTSPPPPICLDARDWFTLQGNYSRTGASNVTLHDSWCDLTLNWRYEDPSTGVSFCGPITFSDKVVCSFTDHYMVLNLITGTPLYTLSGLPEIGSMIRCTPTVAVVGSDTLLFTSGGDAESISAWNFNTGALVWSRDVTTVGPAGLFGQTRWGVFTVLNISGTNYLFWGTDDGKVVGANAQTGTLLSDYPVDLSLSTWVSGATDGENLFFSTFEPGIEGDVYSINAATGTINWQLSTTGGLQAQSIYAHENGYNGDEGFTGGIAYEYGVLYFNSRVEADYPTDGIFYRVDANTGVVLSAAPVNRVFFSTPIIDNNHIYVPSFSRWANPPASGNLYAINKWSGGIEWATSSASGSRYYSQGLLSCEPWPGDNQLYVFNEDGFLSCFNSKNGNEIWRRRVDHGPWPNSTGVSGAITPDRFGDVHILFADLWGGLYDLTKQADRPRLEPQTYNPTRAVEFGANPHLTVVIDDIFVNTGCANLNINSVNVDEDSAVYCNQTIPNFTATNVDTDFMDRAARIADKLARDAYLSKFLRVDSRILKENDIFTIREESRDKVRINRAAAGFPPYLNSVIFPTAGSVIHAGDTADLVLDVNQPLVTRGPHSFFLSMCTDDPDFFLNDPTKCACIKVTLIGACLIDTTTLYFGMGGANMQWVTNTGRLGTGNWDPHGFEIDGDGTSYYQGAYVYAVSSRRIATNTQDWASGGGENDAFVSMQGDPNWCDNDCKPYLNTGVPLGAITRDGGFTYDPIYGEMVCKSFLDSVQNFDLGDGWDWKNWNAPFDNDSTMGLYANTRTIGAVDIPELANVTVEILEFTERNGDSLTGWHLGSFHDFDIGGDTVNIDRNISTCWDYNRPAMNAAWGEIKLPFGCGYEPIINVHGMFGRSNPGNGLWNWYGYWDSCYTWMTDGPGHFSQNMSEGDGEAHFTLAAHDFGPNETYTLGVAHFGLFGLNDASSSSELAPLSTLVNKWVGFNRGDVNNDGTVNLADIIYLAATINGGPGAIPFAHLGDVNIDGNIDIEDVNYLIDFYFWRGPYPRGDWVF